MSDALEALARGPLFSGLTPQDLEPLAPVRRQAFAKGSLIWLEGDTGEVLQIVLEGRVKMSRVSPGGEELIAMYALPGELCGLPAALIEGATRMTQGQAVEDTTLLSFRSEAFLTLMERQPLVMRRALDVLARATRAALGTLSDVWFLDVRGRVAQKLLDLAESYGEPAEDGTRIGMRISQSTLAGMVAASREKVNRALAALASEGIIRQESGSITILAADRLRDGA